MAVSSLISSSFLLPMKPLTRQRQNPQPSSFKNPSQINKISRNRFAFTVRTAKLPPGVEMPKVEPKFQAPFLGFTRTAEIWNARACMIGLVGTFIVELIMNKGILQVIGVDVGKATLYTVYVRMRFRILAKGKKLMLEEEQNGEQLILVNNCNESMWPGVLGGAGHPTPKDGGFHLGSGEEVVVDVPQKWSGRIWGRQGCTFDINGKGSCNTGDCSGLLRCQGMGGAPPATVVEMTLGSSTSPLHFYDVSLVDGFNLPVSMAPVGGGIGCGVASCEVDLNICCPSALEVKSNGKIVGCKSACLAMQSAKYCCTGDYNNPKTCKPTLFAHLFKAICPKAYSYAFDDASSLNRCRASRYVITFCPPK